MRSSERRSEREGDRTDQGDAAGVPHCLSHGLDYEREDKRRHRPLAYDALGGLPLLSLSLLTANSTNFFKHLKASGIISDTTNFDVEELEVPEDVINQNPELREILLKQNEEVRERNLKRQQRLQQRQQQQDEKKQQ